MSQLLNVLRQQLDPQTVSSMANSIGADPSSTQNAVSTALPLLVGALSRNATSSPQGAQALDAALERDHDGSVLDDLSSLLGGAGGGGGLGGLLGMAGDLMGGGGSSKALDGAGILKHVLGGKQSSIARGIAQATGLSAQQSSQLLGLLAPVVMGALGKVKREQQLGPDGLASQLEQERQQLEEQAPGMSQGGLLQLLDRDDDGSVADDVSKLAKLLGGSGLF
ncbi:MAG: DUF937 domain-containing protein [Bacteroidetes bacterium]|jgi:hypothetical protein|nr:DUF937 domain-containing protein [Bacteroidota bacterium]